MVSNIFKKSPHIMSANQRDSGHLLEIRWSAQPIHTSGAK